MPTKRIVRNPPTAVTLALEQRVKETGAVVSASPHTGLFGLPSDEVYNSSAYRAAKAAHREAFEALRAHNAQRCRVGRAGKRLLETHSQ